MSQQTAAELIVAADHIERYRERVGGLVTTLVGHGQEDAIAAIVEAERSLRTAHRMLERAARLLDR
jgi:hypothetical protein